jgi:hypothetical protein
MSSNHQIPLLFLSLSPLDIVHHALISVEEIVPVALN